MASEIHKFCLSETPFSGDTRQRSVEWILEGKELNDALVYQWLENPNPAADQSPAFIQGGTIERPDGTKHVGQAAPSLPTGWINGDGPVLFIHDDRKLKNIAYRHEKDSDPEVYRVTATYENEDLNAPNVPVPAVEIGIEAVTIGFDIGPENELIRLALETVGEYPPDPFVDFAPDVKSAVNMQHDGTVDGVQIPDASMIFSVSFTQASAWFTAAKLLELAKARGKVNSDTFTINGIAFQSGELRFVGLSGDISTTGSSSLELRFGYRENVTGLEIPGIKNDPAPHPAGIVKDGWDYLWVLYGPGEEAGKPTNKPRGAYVQRLLERTNFTNLFAS